MFGLFDSKSYRGSNFERAILSRVDQISNESTDDSILFTTALIHEHPRFYQTLLGDPSLPELSLDDPNTRDLYIGLAARTAWITGSLVTSAFVAARDYGRGLDELRSRDGVSALAVSSCLVQFLGASDAPRNQTTGGYYRYFSAYLVLRQAFGMFGFLDPWRNFIKTIKIPEGLAGLDLSRWFDDDFTWKLAALAPRAEQQSRDQALHQLNVFRSTIGMIPPPAAAISLNLMLDLPPECFTAAWMMPPMMAPGPLISTTSFPSRPGAQLGPAAMQARSMIINAGVPLPM